MGKGQSRLLLGVFSFIILFSISARGEITFYNAPNEGWKSDIQNVFTRVNEILPPEFPIPKDFIVVYTNDIDIKYYPVYLHRPRTGENKEDHHVLVVGGTSEESKLVHEYGHLVLDVYLRKYSDQWLFFITWITLDHAELEPAVQSARANLAQLERTLEEYLVKFPDMENIHNNLSNSIAKEENRLSRIELARGLNSKYAYDLAQKELFKYVTPYMELFSDYLASVDAQDWGVNTRVMINDMVNTSLGERIVFAPLERGDVTVEVLASHRGFPRGVDLENYHYHGWENESAYTQFMPVRSYLRAQSDFSVVPVHNQLSPLALAIQQTIAEEAFPVVELNKFSISEKNQRLAARLIGFQSQH